MTPPALLRALWRRLAALYPADFRDDCGAEMESTFATRYRAARAAGWIAALRFAVRELAALARGAVAERLTHPGGPAAGRAPIVVAQDVRYAARRLLRTPVFTVLTVLVLAGGLGISIFTWSFLRTAVSAPIPVEQGDRVVRLGGRRPNGGSGPIDAAELARIRLGLTTLTDVGAFADRGLTVGAGDGAWTLDATATEWNLFAAARVRPLLGRTFTPADQERGAEAVVVLSHRAWRVGFGTDTAIVGRRVELNRVPTRVVGVMPEGFEFPVAADAWVPIDPVLLDPLATSGAAYAFARLADGVTMAAARAELNVLLARARADRAVDPDEEATRPVAVSVESFPMAQVGEEGLLFVGVLNGLAALILLLACINVGNLLMARANERRRELALRLALGAARPRLVMQHLWETILLCLLGGAIATAIAAGGLELIDAWARGNLEGNLAFWWRWGFDGSTLLAAGGFVTLAVVALGAAVSLRATRERFADTLRAGAAPTETREDTRWSSALVVIQIVAVSVVMFAGVASGIVGHQLLNVDVGHDTSRLIRTGFVLPEGRYPSPSDVSGLRRRLADALAARPEVERLQFQAVLAGMESDESRIEVAGHSAERGDAPRGWLVAVDGSLATLGATMVSGRFFEATDGPDAAPVAVVSQALAGRIWPAGSAVGRQLRLPGLEGDGAPWRTVVGVAGDVPYGPPIGRGRSPIAAYLPLDQTTTRGAALLVKHRGPEEAARAAIVETVAAADPGLDLLRPQSFQTMFDQGSTMIRATARMFGGCFVFALLLAVSGTYGLVARTIARRTREIGIRRALGASDGRILQLLVWQGGRHLGLGALIALPFTGLAALVLARELPIEPAVALLAAVAVSVSIAATVFVATWLPTRRAVRIEPRDALWQEG